MTDEPSASEPSSELKFLEEEIHKLSKAHRYESQWQVIQEALPRARSSQDFDATISFLFSKANSCNKTATPKRQREASVELITLLESEDAARSIQPDLSEEVYEINRHWYTSCAYDNLAVATASMEGYNSEGMYGAVSEGIEKCRETGKLQCITCFREYAVEVSMAADDLEMAMKQALHLAQREPEKAQHDRRSVSWKDISWIHTLEGRLEAALEALKKSFEVATDYHDPEGIRLGLFLMLEGVWLLMGQPEAYQAFVKDHPLPERPPVGEDLSLDRVEDHSSAIKHCLAGDFDKAAALHEKWCDIAKANNHLSNWFEDRSRYLAVKLLSGQSTEELKDIIEDLRDKASKSRNWITLRRMAALFDGDAVINPIASCESFLLGPYSQKIEPAKEPSSTAKASDTQTDDKTDGDTDEDIDEDIDEELKALIDGFNERVEAAEDVKAEFERLAGEILDISPMSIESSADAKNWMVGAAYSISGGVETERLYKAVRLVQKRFPECASVTGLHAQIANILVRRELGHDLRLTDDDVEAMFQKAMSLDVSSLGNHLAAGEYYVTQGRVGEAERCFARAFRLDRTRPDAALSLAQIYRETDRSHDALEVLDLAIRHGCEQPGVVWDAALAAFGLSLWQRALTTMDLFLTLEDTDNDWVHYYRSLCLIELERFDEALEAMDQQLEIKPELELVSASLKALIASKQKQTEALKAALEKALVLPLKDLPLNRQGLSKTLERCRQSALDGKLDDQARAFEARALVAGVLQESVLQDWRCREDNESKPDVGIFKVSIKQELPENWAERANCPIWEQRWTGYQVVWFVLATDADEAESFAKELHQRCLEADFESQGQVTEVTRHSDKLYHDQCGVIDHGVREPTGFVPDSDSDSDSDSETEMSSEPDSNSDSD